MITQWKISEKLKLSEQHLLFVIPFASIMYNLVLRDYLKVANFILNAYYISLHGIF